MFTADDRTQLEKLLRGELPPDQVEHLSAQFGSDQQLSEIAQSLAPNDTLIESLKNHTLTVDPADESLSERLISRLKVVLTASDHTVALPAEAVDEAGEATPAPDMLEYFRIVKELGQGGMGTVYLAEDTRLGRQVAIKTLKRDLATKPTAKDRFFREAKAAAKLNHDHIIPIYHVGESNGIPFLAMPFLKGTPLDDRLKKQKGPLPLSEIFRIGREIALGLAAAHEQGLIHRDIKPANIWLEGPNGRAKILDFGLARSQSEEAHLTASGMIMGTPAYMAPEQARGLPVDNRADLFSLGVMLYEMSTGKKPFTGPDMMAILTSLALDEPPLVNTINPAIPQKLANLIARLMSKAQGSRPNTAQAVADELLAISMQSSRPTFEMIEEPAASPWGGIDESTPPTEANSIKEEKPRPAKKKPNKWLLPVVSLFGLLIVTAAVIVIIKDKNGKKVAEITVPDGGKVEIVDQGKPKPVTPVIPEIPVDDADRKAAERIINQGGRVTVDFDGIPISEISKLPSRRFKLNSILLVAKSQTDDDLKIFEDCKYLTNVDLSSPNISSQGLLSFSKSKGLLGLNLDSAKLDQGLRPVLKTFPDLDYLNISRTSINDEQLEELQAFTKLARLIIVSTKTTEAGVRKFAKAMPQCRIEWDGGVIEPNTTSDVLSANKLHQFGTLSIRKKDNTFEQIKSQQSLPTVPFQLIGFITNDSVKYPVNFVSQTLLPALQPLNQFVDITDNNMMLKWTDEEFIQLASFPFGSKMEQLKTAFPLNKKTLEQLKKMPNLISINAVAAEATDQEIRAILELPKLSFLGLTQIEHAKGITFDSFKAIAKKPLKILSLSEVTITAEHAKLLATMMTLEQFGSNKIDSISARELAKSQSIRVLILGGNEITDHVIDELRTMTQLTSLLLHGTKVTKAGLSKLAIQLPKCRIEWDGGVIEPSIKEDSDRKAAAYVLSVGGTVRVNGVDPEIRVVANLPKEPFQLTHIAIAGDDRVTDEGLACFNGCVNLTSVNLFNFKNCTDAGLAHFANNTKIEILALAGPQWSDAGLVHFKDCKNLTLFDLHGLRVSDAGLAYFKDCKKLTGLNLTALKGDSPVSDAGLAYFKDCKDLNRLNLLHLTEVTDAGLAVFKGCNKLSGINFQGMPKVSDAGLAHFKDCTNLDLIYLNGLHISDAGLAHFKNCKKLGSLAINATSVSDAGLAYLKDCDSLVQLDLKMTKISPAKIEELKKIHPKCRIEWDGGVIEPSIKK